MIGITTYRYNKTISHVRIRSIRPIPIVKISIIERLLKFN